MTPGLGSTIFEGSEVIWRIGVAVFRRSRFSSSLSLSCCLSLNSLSRIFVLMGTASSLQSHSFSSPSRIDVDC